MTKTFAQGGGATPNELFAFAARAMETKDYAAFGNYTSFQKMKSQRKLLNSVAGESNHQPVRPLW